MGATGRRWTDSPLADAWQRFEWAQDEGNKLARIRNEIRKSGIYKNRTMFDGEIGLTFGHRLIGADEEAQIFSDLERALGTYLDHTRAALNYAAVELGRLAIREDPSLEGVFRPESLEFPIFEDRDQYQRQNRVKKLPDNYRSAIEAMQPFGDRSRGLWLLHILDAEYRHHTLHPAAVIAYEEMLVEVQIAGKLLPAESVEIVERGALGDGALLLRFRVFPVIKTNDVLVRFPIAMGIDHELCRGREATGVLADIRAEARLVLSSLEMDFFTP